MKKLLFALLALAIAVINAYALESLEKKEMTKKTSDVYFIQTQKDPAI